MSEKKCCRVCLKEIRNRGTFTDILMAPDPVVHLRDGEVPATSFLHCYYFCLKPNTVQFNMDNLTDYSYICGTCKTLLLKSVGFIIQSQKNENFLKAMYDIRKDEVVIDSSDDSVTVGCDIGDSIFATDEAEESKNENEMNLHYSDENEVYEENVLEEMEMHEFDISTEEDIVEDELMESYSIQIEEVRELDDNSCNTEEITVMDNLSVNDELHMDPMTKNTFFSRPTQLPLNDFADENEEEVFDELEEILKIARKKVLGSKEEDTCQTVVKGSSKKVRPNNSHSPTLESDNKKWKILPKESFNPGFKCLLCRINCDTQRLLFEHYDSVHDQNSLAFPCDVCKRRHISQKALMFHKHRIHNNIEYEDCNLCGLSLLPSFYKAHKERHKNAVQYACTNCDRIFDRLCALKQHYKAIHETHKLRRYECPDCDRHFFSEEKLNAHKVAHENNDVNEVEFLCHICSKTFPKKSDLQLHLKVHSGNIIKCPHCAKEFVRTKDMEYHMRSHTKDFPFQCNICSRGFAVRWNLDAHLKKHKGLRYKCKICKREYFHISGLREHTYQHLGYPLTCKLCGKGYAVKRKLRNHLKKAHSKRFEDENSESTIDGYIVKHKVQNLFDTKEEFIEQ